MQIKSENGFQSLFVAVSQFVHTTLLFLLTTLSAKRSFVFFLGQRTLFQTILCEVADQTQSKGKVLFWSNWRWDQATYFHSRQLTGSVSGTLSHQAMLG